MGYLAEIQLLTSCCNTLLPLVNEREQECLQTLEQIGSTSMLNSYRALQLQRIIIVVGMFSVFEAAVKDELNQSNSNIEGYLEAHGNNGLAKRYAERRLAINVLKHGSGRSHKKLWEQRKTLDFRIKQEDECFFEEGDLANGHALILVDDDFIIQCAELLDDISSKILNQEGY